MFNKQKQTYANFSSSFTKNMKLESTFFPLYHNFILQTPECVMVVNREGYLGRGGLQGEARDPSPTPGSPTQSTNARKRVQQLCIVLDGY